MEEIKITYKVQSASNKDILNHLLQSDETFIPFLSSRVDLVEYAAKLYSFSVTFEAWDQDKLVGLIAAYFNNPISKTAYISSVSVLMEYQGMGIAKRLVYDCLSYAKEMQFEKILLEVDKENNKAINLYTKLGFKLLDNSENTLILVLSLND